MTTATSKPVQTTRSEMRPPRTLGLSLAIILSVILFTILPLLPVIWLILFRIRISETCAAFGFADDAMCGAELFGVDEPSFVLLGVLGILFLFVAIFAWHGRPPWIRFVMVAAVLLFTLLILVVTLLPLFAQPDPTQGVSTSLNELLCFVWPPFLLIPTYIIWYLNRGPARAFYRGYYLPDPDETEHQEAS